MSLLHIEPLTHNKVNQVFSSTISINLYFVLVHFSRTDVKRLTVHVNNLNSNSAESLPSEYISQTFRVLRYCVILLFQYKAYKYDEQRVLCLFNTIKRGSQLATRICFTNFIMTRIRQTSSSSPGCHPHVLQPSPNGSVIFLCFNFSRDRHASRKLPRIGIKCVCDLPSKFDYSTRLGYSATCSSVTAIVGCFSLIRSAAECEQERDHFGELQYVLHSIRHNLLLDQIRQHGICMLIFFCRVFLCYIS